MKRSQKAREIDPFGGMLFTEEQKSMLKEIVQFTKDSDVPNLTFEELVLLLGQSLSDLLELVENMNVLDMTKLFLLYPSITQVLEVVRQYDIEQTTGIQQGA